MKFRDDTPYRSREITINDIVEPSSSESLVKRIKDVCDQIGVEIPNKSRFGKYIDILMDYQSDQKLRKFAYVEIYHLIAALYKLQNIETWKDTIKLAINYDPLIPQREAVNSNGRDALFELYLAGRFNAASITSKKEEPDIVGSINGVSFSVAAKRIKSVRKIFKRCKSARDQISKSKIPGIIALDLTPTQENYHDYAPLTSVYEFQMSLKIFLDNAFEPICNDIKTLCSGHRVLGIIAFVTSAVLAKENKHTILISTGVSGFSFFKMNTSEGLMMHEIVERLNYRPLLMDQ